MWKDFRMRLVPFLIFIVVRECELLFLKTKNVNASNFNLIFLNRDAYLLFLAASSG